MKAAQLNEMRYAFQKIIDANNAIIFLFSFKKHKKI